MKPEAKFWAWLRDKIASSQGFEFERIENRVGRSTPDVAFSWSIGGQITPDSVIQFGHGWIELKAIQQISEERKATGGVVGVPHFTKGQKRWLAHRGAMGGFCYLLLEAGDKIFLFDHKNCHEVGSLSWQEMIKNSVYSWTKDRFRVYQFLSFLTIDHR